MSASNNIFNSIVNNIYDTDNTAINHINTNNIPTDNTNPNNIPTDNTNPNNIPSNICNTHGQHCDGACIDPDVDNGMMTKVWGPAGWLFLHCITFGYPYAINLNNKDHIGKKEDYYNFFYYLGKVMPCRYCRESYQDFFKELDLNKSLNNRKDITKWLYDIHNKVNHKLGVPKCDIPSFEEVVSRYEQYRAKCKKTTDEERDLNAKKGCITPADGTPRRCVVKVVPFNKGDITRRDNSNFSSIGGTSDDYIMFSKKKFILYLIIVTIIYLATIYYIKYYK
jgi:hypothetical protein